MPKKRGNNDGTIRQRKDGIWEARYFVGYKDNGKPDQRSVYASSQEEVQKKLRELLRQLDRGEYVEPSKITVGQWLDKWFEVYGKPRWREKTASVHYSNIRLHIKPAMGKIHLQKLRPDHIQAFVIKQHEAGLSPATIRKQLEPFKSAMKQAVDNQLIIRNPAAKIKLPQLEQKEIEFLTLNEQRALLPHLPDNTAGRALQFILRTGLRASELCGLQWDDISGDSFNVRRSAQYVKIPKDDQVDGVKQVLCVAPPKSKASRRRIPLTAAARSLLDAQKSAQMRERLAVGSLWIGEQPGQAGCYVFASEAGTAFDRCNLARTLRSALDKANLKRRGIHALRHTFATNGVRAGIDMRTLSEILGHTKVAFTMQLYVHSDNDTKLAGMQAIDSLL